MRLGASKGQVLVHVLVTAAICAVIAAALMRLVLLRLTMEDRMAAGGQSKMAAQSGFQLLMQDWAMNGTCHDPNGANGNPFHCPGGTAGTCNCTCNGTVAGITLNVTAGGSPCTVNSNTTGQ